MPERESAQNLFLEALDWICNKLNTLQIPYMVTGGSAVGFWGHIRTTMDIDLVIQMRSNQADAFLASIKDEAYVDDDVVKTAIQNKSMFNIIPNETLFKVDIIPLDENNTYEKEKFNRRVKINLRNREIYISSPEDLIISKLVWSKNAGGSERQIADCESIWKINQENLGIDYIKEWVQILNIEGEFKKLNLN